MPLVTDNTGIKCLVKSLLELDANRELYLEAIKEYKETIGSTMLLLSNLNGKLPRITAYVEEIEAVNIRAEHLLNSVTDLTIEYEELANNNFSITSEKLQAQIKEIETLVTYLKEDIAGLQYKFEDSDPIIREVYATLNMTDKTLGNMTQSLHGLEYKLGFLAHDNDINRLIYMLENEPQIVKECIEAPALLNHENIKEIPNYGSAIAPFDITMTIWLGGIILVTLLSTRIYPQMAQLDDISNTQEYLGKWLSFLLLGSIQTLLIILVVNEILRVYIENVGLFVVMGLLGSITFMTMIYTLASALDNLGKVIAYIIPILQLFLLGGVVPMQIIPTNFQSINRLFPFIYVVDVLREIQVGILSSNLIYTTAILIVFIIFYLILGILGRTIFYPYIQKVRDIFHY